MTSPPRLFVQSLKKDLNNVDYSQWERRDRRGTPAGPSTLSGTRSSLPPLPGPPPRSACAKASSRRQRGAASPPTPAPSTAPQRDNKLGSRSSTAQVLESLLSSACRHQRKTSMAETDPSALKKKDNIRVLKLLIGSKKQAIAEFERHHAALQDANLHLVEEIQMVDKNSAAEARELLVHHERLGKSIVAFSGWRDGQLGKAKADLEESESTAKEKLRGLQQQLDQVKSELLRARAEMYTLKTYKDKQYPVKALRITDLKSEVEKLQETHQDKEEDIALLAQSEMAKLEKSLKKTEEEILSSIAKVIEELEEENRWLEQSVQQLQQSRTDIRKKIFHDVFPRAEKCTPDVDVTLNIPREECLPI
ncbi:uncharacterized protein C20orf96 isoform X2 [Amia ocellicauda]|uniref:uncharacterized protein C20orf96 isoform X2 n=1 Tax=Amia ocellicauda TaxID=2972642 RepID=UPI003463D081